MTPILKKTAFCLVLFLTMQKSFAQGVAISLDGSIPHQSAMLDVKSDRRGVLLPKVSLVALNNGAPITNPATGLIVYNTNLNLPGGAGYFYNGGDENNVDWKRLATGNNNNDGWLLTGNAGTNDAINFMGTTDNQNVVFKRGGVKALEIFSGGALLATGNDNGITPISGPGNRMMYIPAKRAFRFGSVDADQWDDGNIGWHSFAAGINCKASSSMAFAMGYASTAENEYTFAYGQNSHSTADNAIAMGYAVNAKGISSVAFGDQAVATGSFSLAIGYGTSAIGSASVALGDGTQALSVFSTATGSGTIAIGAASTSMGQSTIAEARNEVAMGQFNEKQNIPKDAPPQPSDKVLQIGDGIDDNNRKDILYLTRQGDMTITGSLTANGVVFPSDIRLKENIAPLQNVLNSIEHIQPISYNFKDKEKYPSTHQIGFNAQEIEKAFPELVVKNKSGYLAVNYPQMSAIAIQAAKEQQAIIKNQHEQINNLEGKVKNQQEQISNLEGKVKSQEQINNNLQVQITELKKIIKDK